MSLLKTSAQGELTFWGECAHDVWMLQIFLAMLRSALASLSSRRELALENLALRQQLAVLARQARGPKVTNADRAFWAVLAEWRPVWREALLVVKPATVIAWPDIAGA